MVLSTGLVPRWDGKDIGGFLPGIFLGHQSDMFEEGGRSKENPVGHGNRSLSVCRTYGVYTIDRLIGCSGYLPWKR